MGLGIFLSLAQHAAAQDWSVIVNGKAIHVNSSRDWNERNWGLGLEREFDTQSRWVKVALVNGFKDSQNAMSYMAGGGLKRRFRLDSLANDLYVDVGVVGFVMTREDVNHNKPFPGLLPAMTIGTRHVALNLTYLSQSMMDSATNVTRVDPTVSGLLFLQLKLDPRLLGFGPRGRRSAF
ncbi:MAG: hypothetical protein JXB36_01495 [Gammaproteobacteria bacterium]|nr:hypothetical protein [Gammaproteobacteria bacterium]